jgi:hypothetical protein
MPNDDGTFDVSNLEALATLRGEQQGLRDLAARAASHRDQLTEIYARVVRDYESRIGGLEERAQQLQERVRDDFRRLDTAWTAARQSLDQARFGLQESEFRKDIGEFGAEEFQARQKAVEASIAERHREIERLGQLRKRFLDLLAGTPPEAPVPAASTAAARAAAPLPAASIEGAGVPAPAPPVSGPAPASVADARVAPPAPVEPVPALPSLGSPPTTSRALEAFAAEAVPPGVLVEEPVAGAPVTHRLGVITAIGRTTDNQIVIPSREVSRKHAEVVVGPAGFTLRDLGSPNGTFVNGKKVAEHTLKEGDRVSLAGVTLVFKAK